MQTESRNNRPLLQIVHCDREFRLRAVQQTPYCFKRMRICPRFLSCITKLIVRRSALSEIASASVLPGPTPASRFSFQRATARVCLVAIPSHQQKIDNLRKKISGASVSQSDFENELGIKRSGQDAGHPVRTTQLNAIQASASTSDARCFRSQPIQHAQQRHQPHHQHNCNTDS